MAMVDLVAGVQWLGFSSDGGVTVEPSSGGDGAKQQRVKRPQGKWGNVNLMGPCPCPNLEQATYPEIASLPTYGSPLVDQWVRQKSSMSWIQPTSSIFDTTELAS